MDRLPDIFSPLYGLIEQPRYLGEGYDSLVFINPLSPDTVIKASHRVLEEYRGYSLDPLQFLAHDKSRDPRFIWLECDAGMYDLRHQRFAAHLGQEHVVPETTKALYIPLNGRTQRQLWGESPQKDSEVAYFLTLVRHQPLLQPLLYPQQYGTCDIYAPHAEIERRAFENPEVARACNNRWLLGDATADPNGAAFWLLHGNPSLEKLVTRLEEPEFRQDFTVFLAKLMDYMDQTGECPDMGGRNNYIFYEDPHDNKGRILAVDPLHVPEKPLLGLARQVAPRLLAGLYEDKEVSAPLITFSAVRLVNFLATFVALDKWVHVFPRDFAARGICDDNWPYLSHLLVTRLEQIEAKRKAFQPS